LQAILSSQQRVKDTKNTIKVKFITIIMAHCNHSNMYKWTRDLLGPVGGLLTFALTSFKFTGLTKAYPEMTVRYGDGDTFAELKNNGKGTILFHKLHLKNENKEDYFSDHKALLEKELGKENPILIKLASQAFDNCQPASLEAGKSLILLRVKDKYKLTRKERGELYKCLVDVDITLDYSSGYYDFLHRLLHMYFDKSSNNLFVNSMIGKHKQSLPKKVRDRIKREYCNKQDSTLQSLVYYLKSNYKYYFQ
jgi:hypothetical protein